MPIITRAKNFIKLFLCAVVTILSSADGALAEWKIDLSRRQKVMRADDLRQDRSPASEGEATFLNALFAGGDPMQELVILNTDRGFLPSTVRLRKGSKYVIHVVNVNEKDKNVSFVLDAFSEHHATFYGKVKSFHLEPRKEGVYSFQCPETSAEGRVVVFAPAGSGVSVPEVRAPAARDGR